MSVAAIIVGEVIVGIEPPKKVIDAIGGGNLGETKDAVKVVVDQIKSVIDNAGIRSSTFGLGKLLLIEEEEVPRAGIHVERRFNYARTADGRAWLWRGRPKRVGRGEASNGLRFDIGVRRGQR